MALAVVEIGGWNMLGELELFLFSRYPYTATDCWLCLFHGIHKVVVLFYLYAVKTFDDLLLYLRIL